jgi:hypothetical protein
LFIFGSSSSSKKLTFSTAPPIFIKSIREEI